MVTINTENLEDDSSQQEVELSPTNATSKARKISPEEDGNTNLNSQLSLQYQNDQVTVTLGSDEVIEIKETELQNELSSIYNTIVDNAGISPNDGSTLTPSTAPNDSKIPISKTYKLSQKNSKDQQVNVSWSNVSLVLPLKKKSKEIRKGILHSISGEAKAGCVTAIMGPTGCGKTSLLNVLAGRVQQVPGGELSGNIYYNGKDINQNRESLSHEESVGKVAFVTQDDVLFPFFTVKETLLLAASFYLPSYLSPQEKEDIVTSIINQLGLAKVTETIVGNEFKKGLSGGEKKRVCIGIELISNPSILYLDEPTSGLDAFQSLAVMEALSGLAQTGRTIITVIHQPRSAIYDIVDDLILLSEGYALFVGKAVDAVSYFENMGFHIPAFCTCSDFFLDCISMDYRTAALEEFTRQKVYFFAQTWLKHRKDHEITFGEEDLNFNDNNDNKSKKNNKGDHNNSNNNTNILSFWDITTRQGQPKASLWTQVTALLWRSFENAKRNVFGLLIGTVLSIIFGIMFGGIFSKEGTGQKGITDKVGLLLMCTINGAFAGMGSVLNVFPVEKNIIKKERASNAYYLFTYFIAKIVTEIPFNLFPSFIFIVLVYFFARLDATVEKFFYFTLLLGTENLCAMAAGLWVSSMSSTVEVANAIAPALNIVFTLFNGFLINVDDLPRGSRWVAEVSFTKYVFEGLMYNEYNGQTYECDDSVNQASCITEGEQILEQFGYQNANILLCAFYVFIIGLVFAVLTYLTLWFSSEKYMKINDRQTIFPDIVSVYTSYPKYLDFNALNTEAATASLGIEEKTAMPSEDIQPITISWKNINFHIPIKRKSKSQKTQINEKSGGTKKEDEIQQQQQQLEEAKEVTEVECKRILQNISGSVAAGTLTAIMGPSGSGKTSLLNILANRVISIPGATLTGSIELNGKPRDEEIFKEISAYVLQHDVLYSFMTVYETLSLAANFFYGNTITLEAREILVNNIILSLGLLKCKDTIIGDENSRGISGGERKRVSIGVEMVSNPSILFLDEPTSGLDSFQALSVMSVMASLANSGRTIVASIHQPRTSIYNKLSSVILMSEGQVIYIGDAKDAIKFFEKASFICPQSVNIADFYLDVISMDYRNAEVEAESRQRIQLLTSMWNDDAHANHNNNIDIESGHISDTSNNNTTSTSTTSVSSSDITSGSSSSFLTETKKKDPFMTTSSIVGRASKVGWFVQLYYLLWRQSVESSKNYWALRIRILQSLLFGVLFGLIWSDITNDQTGIQSIVGLFFICSLNTAFTSCAATLNVFPKEKLIVRKEEAANSYSLSAYYISKLIAEGPINVIIPFVFASIIFWVSGLPFRSFTTYIFFSLFVVCSSLCGIAEGIMLSAIAPNAQIGQAMMPPVNVFAMLFSGVMINVDSLPVAVQWISKISFVRWIFEGLLVNQLQDATFTCEGSGRCLSTGEDVLAVYSFENGTIGLCYAMTFVTIIGFLIVGYYFLWANRIKYMPLLESSTFNLKGKGSDSKLL